MRDPDPAATATVSDSLSTEEATTVDPRSGEADASTLLDNAGLSAVLAQVRDAVAARVARTEPGAGDPASPSTAELAALRTRAADAEAEAARFAAERDEALARVATAEATIAAVTEALAALRASIEV